MQFNKSAWLQVIVLLLVLVLGAIEYIHNQEQREALQIVQSELLLLKNELQKTNQRFGDLQEKTKMLDESSVEGIVNNANDAIIDGWQALLDRVNNELKNVKESLKSNPNPQSVPLSPQNQPPQTQNSEVEPTKELL